jgi:hypothetical protein
MRSNTRFAWLFPALAVAMAAPPALAQTGAPIDTTGAAADITNSVPPKLEFVLERIDGQVACRTPGPRVPANTPVDLKVTNRSGGPAVFSAIQFLVVSKNLKSDASSDAFLGRIGLNDSQSVDLHLRTPARAGEYPFACVEPEPAGFHVPGPSGMQAEPVKTDGVFVVGADMSPAK